MNARHSHSDPPTRVRLYGGSAWDELTANWRALEAQTRRPSATRTLSSRIGYMADAQMRAAHLRSAGR